MLCIPGNLSNFLAQPQLALFQSIHLIVQYAMKKHGAVRLVELDGKHFYDVVDEALLHKAFGELLAELMRIKAEGDYAAACDLMNEYAIKIDPTLRDEIKARAKALELPMTIANVFPRLTRLKMRRVRSWTPAWNTGTECASTFKSRVI